MLLISVSFRTLPLLFPATGKNILVALLVLVLHSAIAQERYLESITDEVITETHTYAFKEGASLDLDMYLPAYDPETERPLIIYVHGGGFQSGSRDTEGIKTFCTDLASCGYVVSSIAYRLTRKGTNEGFGCDCPADEKLNTFQAAVEDLQDAVFYLIENREQFAIDPQKIILSGSSAGAETVLIAAYEPPYCFGLESGPVSFAGVIGMAGAVPDTNRIYKESAIPSLLFHGTDDKLVPYASDAHHFCKSSSPGYLILHGSYTIAQKLKNLDVPCWLHTTCGGEHELSYTPMNLYAGLIKQFCYEYVLAKNGEYRHTIVQGKSPEKKSALTSFCNP